MEAPPEDDVCSICHDRFYLPCRANCSHWFCGKCILCVWHHGSALRPCNCPICRRFITSLMPTNAAVQDCKDPEASQVLVNIERYNRLFGRSPSSFLQKLQDVLFFIRRLSKELMDPQRSVPLDFRVQMNFSMALSAMYVLSPVNILPEEVYGFVGLLDDLLILLVIFLLTAVIYHSVPLRHGGS